MRSRLCLAILVGTLSSCATHQPSPEQLAEIRALELDSALRLSLDGNHHYLADTYKRDGYEYCSLSVNLTNQGDFRPSIREASKALYLGEQSGDRYLLALANRDLAYAYSFAGQLGQARHFAEAAIEKVKGVPFDREPILGRAHKILGDVDRREGLYGEAVAAYELALKTGGSEIFPEVTASLAYTYLAAGDLERARELFDEAASWRAGSLQPVISRGMGDVAFAAGEYEQAIQLYARAAGSADDKDYAYHRFWALAGMARSQAAAGDSGQALQNYLEALSLADSLRGQFRSEEFRAGFFANTQDVFDETVALLVKDGQTARAFEISERSRARATLDLLRGRVEMTERARVYTNTLARPVSLTEVRAALSENVALIYLRSEANKQRFLAAGPQSDMLHIATHARVDPADPLHSTIELAPSEDSDGILEAHEVYGIDFSDTALVTLSACDTALGRVSRGDELWGFTRTFFGAGASAVLVSLWPVSDQATEKLMTEFYASLGLLSAQEALREAQLALIDDDELNAPVYWASFDLVGDPR